MKRRNKSEVISVRVPHGTKEQASKFINITRAINNLLESILKNKQCPTCGKKLKD